MGFNMADQEPEEIPYSPTNTYSHAAIGFGLFCLLLTTLYFFKLVQPETLSLGPCVLCFLIGMIAALIAVAKPERLRWLALSINALPIAAAIASMAL